MAHKLNTDSEIEAALCVLRRAGLVAVPTETVYGLAADATNKQAVAKIYKAKGRPGFNPLIAHVSGLQMAQQFAIFNERAQQLAARFWPGPLTLVLPLRPNSTIAPNVTAGLDTIALRQPTGPMAKLAESLGNPIAAPSANTSGKISPTLAKHVADDLGDKVDLILDGGPCTVGLESTIVKVGENGLTLLREGGLAREVIEAEFGPLADNITHKKIEAPGMLLAHYAPSLPVRLDADHAETNEALLYMGARTTTGQPQTMRNLSPNNDVTEAAHNLFAMLQELDNSGAVAIAVQRIPNHGLGAAINDRLSRAAQGAHATKGGSA